MRHGVGNVQQERLALIALNEIDRMLGVPGGEHRLMLRRHALDLDLPVLPKLQRKLTYRSGFSGWNSHMSFEYINPQDSSNPLAGGRVSGWSPMCHLPKTAVR